jgi:ribonucleotide monophosphatase NagD (HAD superfamily)
MDMVTITHSCGHVRRYSPWGLGWCPEVAGWPCKGCCDAAGSVLTWQERISLVYMLGDRVSSDLSGGSGSSS